MLVTRPAAGGVGGGRVGVTTPDPAMARYTPSSVDQAARDRAWMNTCSSLSAAAQAKSHHQEITTTTGSSYSLTLWMTLYATTLQTLTPPSYNISLDFSQICHLWVKTFKHGNEMAFKLKFHIRKFYTSQHKLICFQLRLSVFKNCFSSSKVIFLPWKENIFFSSVKGVLQFVKSVDKHKTVCEATSPAYLSPLITIPQNKLLCKAVTCQDSWWWLSPGHTEPSSAAAALCPPDILPLDGDSR